MFYFIVALIGLADCAPLELVSAYRLNTEVRYDLSGLLVLSPSQRADLQTTADALAVNDKSSTIDEIFFQSDGAARYRTWVDLKGQVDWHDFDLEGLASNKNSVFVVNEFPPAVARIRRRAQGFDVNVYRWKQSLNQLFPEYTLSSAFGIEGITTSANHILLAKEMPPLAIYSFDSRALEVAEVKLSSRKLHGSQTALTAEGDWLYILDRENRSVWKHSLNESSHETKKEGIETCVSFQDTIMRPDYYFPARDRKGQERPEWSTAEALSLSATSLWIGLDNNGESLKKRAENRPVILEFKRPSGF
jgi:hypothetical protein